MSKKKIQLTKEKLNNLKLELKNLIDVERPKIIEEIKNARAQGDLSENAEYDAARDKQGIVEDRIRELENLLQNIEIIDKTKLSKKSVSTGSRVLVQNLKTKKEDLIEIVSTLESDPFSNKISFLSPLGSALIGKELGAVVEVDAPTKYKVSILKID